jgi:hypothetical protein
MVRIPTSANHSANSRGRGAPPEMKASARPPMPLRIFENTSASASFQESEFGLPLARNSSRWARPTLNAQRKIARFIPCEAFLTTCERSFS